MSSMWKALAFGVICSVQVAANAQIPVQNQVAILGPGDGNTANGFGSDIAIDGPTAVVGASRDSDLAVRSGAAYVYERDGERIGSLYYDFSAAQHTLSIPGASVSQEDFILLTGFAWNGGGARIDKVVFTPR
jgi:hypothetical protein